MTTTLTHVRPNSPGEARPSGGWLGRAACRALPTELFFPAGELDEQAVEQAEEAKSVCASCPVRVACLEFAIATNQPYGIWGGANASERRSIRRRRQAERRRQAS